MSFVWNCLWCLFKTYFNHKKKYTNTQNAIYFCEHSQHLHNNVRKFFFLKYMARHGACRSHNECDLLKFFMHQCVINLFDFCVLMFYTRNFLSLPLFIKCDLISLWKMLRYFNLVAIIFHKYQKLLDTWSKFFPSRRYNDIYDYFFTFLYALHVLLRPER